MKRELKRQISAEERAEIVELFARSFPVDYSHGLESFGFLVDCTPDKAYVTVRSDAGELLGALCLLDRQFNYLGLSLPATVMSCMAVRLEYRDFSVTEELKAGLFEYLDAHSDVCLGIARKVMDGYWYPYGYLGFTNFGRMSVDLSKLPIRNHGLSVTALEDRSVNEVAALHRETYTGVMGGLSRDLPLWRFLVAKLKRENRTLEAIKDGPGRIVGYLLAVANNIQELAIAPALLGDCAAMLLSFVKERAPGARELHLEIGLTHSLSHYLRRLPHSVSTRFAWNGGHLIRVASVSRLLRKIQPILENRLLSAQIGDFDVSWEGIRLVFASDTLDITDAATSAANETTQRHQWEKLIFGVADASEVLGEKAATRLTVILRVMFPVQQPQVPYLDQS